MLYRFFLVVSCCFIFSVTAIDIIMLDYGILLHNMKVIKYVCPEYMTASGDVWVSWVEHFEMI